MSISSRYTVSSTGFPMWSSGTISMNRRSFLFAGGGAMLHAAPSDTITLGVIGAGGRGTFVMTTFQKSPNVRVGAICDVYEPNLERGLSTASKAQGSAPKAYRNYKELLGGQEHRRGADRDSGTLARTNGAGRAGRGQGRLRRKAAVPHAGRRRCPGGSGEEVEADHPGGHAAAQLRPVSGGPQDRRRRDAGQRADGALLVAEQLRRRRREAHGQARRAARLGAVAGSARRSAFLSTRSFSATGARSPTTPAASWRTRARTSTTASTC